MKIFESANGTSSVYENSSTGVNWPNSSQVTGMGYDWNGGNNSVNVVNTGSNDVWGNNIQSTTVSGIGVGASNIGVDQGFTKPLDVAAAINVPNILEIIKQAEYLYNSGSHDKKLPATAMDLLRNKMKNQKFDPYNSAELKDVFGYILGDLISELIVNRGADYDEIINELMRIFPKGTGNPIKSEYAGSKYANVGKYGKLIGELRKFITRNKLNTPTTLAKFLKLWDQFKTDKSEYDKLDVEDVFKYFVG